MEGASFSLYFPESRDLGGWGRASPIKGKMLAGVQGEGRRGPTIASDIDIIYPEGEGAGEQGGAIRSGFGFLKGKETKVV